MHDAHGCRRARADQDRAAAGGGAQEIQNILIRLKEIALQSATATYSNNERSFLDKEFRSLKDEIDRITRSTEFNGRYLLDGTEGNINLQVNVGGLNLVGLDHISFNLSNLWMNIDNLNLTNANISDRKGAQKALALLDHSLDQAARMRSTMGGLENRLNATSRIISSSVENLGTAHSRIKDTDYAKETAELTQHNILVQAGISVLSQTGNIQRMALDLLKT